MTLSKMYYLIIYTDKPWKTRNQILNLPMYSHILMYTHVYVIQLSKMYYLLKLYGSFVENSYPKILQNTPKLLNIPCFNVRQVTRVSVELTDFI